MADRKIADVAELPGEILVALGRIAHLVRHREPGPCMFVRAASMVAFRVQQAGRLGDLLRIALRTRAASCPYGAFGTGVEEAAGLKWPMNTRLSMASI